MNNNLPHTIVKLTGEYLESYIDGTLLLQGGKVINLTEGDLFPETPTGDCWRRID